MAATVFDRETILDLMVNVIPLAILAFFFLAFVVFNPFGNDVVIVSIQLGIIGLMFVGLAAITYYSGAAVSKAESAAEADETPDGTVANDDAEADETPDRNAGDVDAEADETREPGSADDNTAADDA